MRFGWLWTALGVALLAAAVATGTVRELDTGELILILVFVGLSLGCVLGALLLAQRTGPEILYYRILEYAPPPPGGVPVETPGATTRRIAPPAFGVALALLWVAVIGTGMMLLMGGEPREGVADDIPAGALIAGGTWTLVAGLAGLRMGAYFQRWQQLRDALVLCRPYKAGTMRPVYWVERAESPHG
jgi:hypothetical protein